MKKKIWLAAVLAALALGGCGKAPAETEATTLPTTAPTETAPQAAVEAVLLLAPDGEELRLYPFSDAELEAARAAVEELIREMAEQDGVLYFDLERIAFDPMVTDDWVRAASEQPEDYAGRISFVVTYSAGYDPAQTYLTDAAHKQLAVNLIRESAESAWEIQSSQVLPEETAGFCLSAGELAALETEKPALAGFTAGEDAYWLYMRGAAEGSVVLQQVVREAQMPQGGWDESEYQVGEPITPQPGDTTETWDPELAENYPADSECRDMELLEKWMAVEGLSWADLDERNCNQLILTVAQDNGTGTITVCYERQAGGVWTAVPELERMEGWVGSGGIMHNRRRGTNTSPAGLWSIGTAFGNAEEPEGLNMPWRDVTPESDWVCDESSIYFNTWQERDDPALERWSSDVEHLENYQTQYAYACVIRFNTPPYMIPKRGCAIFLHCSKNPTGGCIGLLEADMLEVLHWLDWQENPHILITGYQEP